jgi:DNA replication protein DnaC
MLSRLDEYMQKFETDVDRTQQKWAELLSNLENPNFKNKIVKSMNEALDAKELYYTKLLQKTNEKIVESQVNVLKTWCSYGMTKAWLYYYDYELKKLKEIRVGSLSDDINETVRLISEGKLKLDKDVAKYLISMGALKKDGKIKEDEAKIRTVLNYLRRQNQCDTFSSDWTSTTASNTSSEDRMIIDGNEAMAAIEKANEFFFDALKTMNRISSILESLKATKNLSADTRYKELKDAIRKFDNTIYGKSRDNIKNKIGAIVMGFSNDPKLFLNSHLNISLTGPPGTGKTSVASGVGNILTKLGLLIKGTEMATHSRATMVGQYVGQTATKVRNILISNIESVMFIDEAYSLAQSSTQSDEDDEEGGGGTPSYDQYGVEAINEIVGFLQLYKGKICIITAGYEDEMKKFYFDVNPGMERRVPWKWELGPFSPSELYCIMEHNLVLFHGEKDANAMDEILDEPSKILLNSVFHHTKGIKEKGAVEIKLREYFQNEGGDMELIAGNIAQEFYLQDKNNRKPLTLEKTMSTLWDYLKQRDGKVLAERGKKQKQPAFFKEDNEPPKVTLVNDNIILTFANDYIIEFPMKLPEPCYPEGYTKSFDQEKTWKLQKNRWILPPPLPVLPAAKQQQAPRTKRN